MPDRLTPAEASALTRQLEAEGVLKPRPSEPSRSERIAARKRGDADSWRSVGEVAGGVVARIAKGKP